MSVTPGNADSTVEVGTLPVADWRAYRALRLRSLREAPAAFGWRHADLARRPGSYWRGKLAAALEGATEWLLFTRIGGRLVGVAGAYLDPHEQAKDAAHVYGVYVCPEARGRGAATLLLTSLLDRLRGAGLIRRVVLYASAEQEPAVRLYRRLGFTVAGRERGRLGDGRDHDLLRMERSLVGD